MGIAARTLLQGEQSAELIGAEVASFLDGARRSLDLALYDVRLPGEVGDRVAGALRAAADRGVSVRMAYNLDRDDVRRKGSLAPPLTEPDRVEALPFPTLGIPGEPDLMHHKFVVRDGADVWSGSANWTLDSWRLQENVIVLTEGVPAIARAYEAAFEQLWTSRRVEGSGDIEPAPVEIGPAVARAWFSPGRGPELSQRIATAIGRARRRVRIASPVITAGPILGTLAEMVVDRRVDLAAVVDATQAAHVLEQWAGNPHAQWKIASLRTILGSGEISGKRSTPYRPGSVRDFMHAKVTVADDTVFAGSFNLSHSGERNAENVLEVRDPALAERMAAFVDAIRSRYPDPVALPGNRPGSEPTRITA